MTLTDTTVEFSRDEIVEQLESTARELGMSAAEMLAAFADRQLGNPSDVLDVLALADLLPESDPIRRVERDR